MTTASVIVAAAVGTMATVCRVLIAFVAAAFTGEDGACRLAAARSSSTRGQRNTGGNSLESSANATVHRVATEEGAESLRVLDTWMRTLRSKCGVEDGEHAVQPFEYNVAGAESLEACARELRDYDSRARKHLKQSHDTNVEYRKKYEETASILKDIETRNVKITSLVQQDHAEAHAKIMKALDAIKAHVDDIRDARGGGEGVEDEHLAHFRKDERQKQEGNGATVKGESEEDLASENTTFRKNGDLSEARTQLDPSDDLTEEGTVGVDPNNKLKVVGGSESLVSGSTNREEEDLTERSTGSLVQQRGAVAKNRHSRGAWEASVSASARHATVQRQHHQRHHRERHHYGGH